MTPELAGAYKYMRVTRCDKDNIREICKQFKRVNERIRRIVDKVLVTGNRPQERENRELQQLLSIQSRLSLIRILPGSGNVQINLFSNHCHTAMCIKNTLREAERRHNLRILNEYW